VPAGKRNAGQQSSSIVAAAINFCLQPLANNQHSSSHSSWAKSTRNSGIDGN